jgi:hypothetical protein
MPWVLGLLLCGSMVSAAQVTTVLQVTAEDDSLPDPSRSLTYAWTVLEAPTGAQVGFLPSADVPAPTVSFDRPGRYLIGVVVDDGHLGTGQTLAIQVLASTSTPAEPSSSPAGGCGGGSALAVILGLLGLSRWPFSRASAVPARGTARRP